MPDSHILQFIGGLAFFFFGLYTIHQALHYFAGDRLKGMIARTTAGRIRSCLTGVVVTLFFQSSSAVTAMLVGLASSGLLGLEQAMAVALGAGIGTTFVILLISIKSIVQYGIVVIVFGLLVRFLSERKIMNIAGEVILGFGLVFFGLTIMSQATQPLQDYPVIPQIFLFMEEHPFYNLLIAAILTAVVQSSGVVLGILISLGYTGTITFEVAFPLILGANVGTAFTAIIVSFRSKTEGKRIAWANLVIRLGGALLLYPFIDHVISFFHRLHVFVLSTLFDQPVTVYGEIAWCHFFFNVYVAVVFLPLLPLGKKIVCWAIPQQKGEDDVFGPRYLDKSALSTPTLAFTQMTRELVRMGEIVQKMFRESLSLFEKYNHDREDSIKASDHQVDTLYKAMKFYLAKMSLKHLKEEEANTGVQLITAVNEMENIGDTIDRHIARLAHKKHNRGVQFSEEGWKEICEMHQKTLEMIGLALAALASSNEEIAFKMLTHQTHYVEREDMLKMSHLMRLNKGLQESIGSSAIHLELLSMFHRINLSLLTMVRHMLPEREREREEE